MLVSPAAGLTEHCRWKSLPGSCSRLSSRLFAGLALSVVEGVVNFAVDFVAEGRPFGVRGDPPGVVVFGATAAAAAVVAVVAAVVAGRACLLSALVP